MLLASRWRKILGSNESAKRSLAKNRRPLRLEPLEDRRMLSITLFVDDDATAGGYGLSWSTAHANLQDALTMAEVLNADEIAANDVDQIWIAEGTYYPTKELEPGDVRSASFSLLDGVSLYGGFAGTETSLAERDLSLAHTTTLSGDLGTLDDTSDNAYTVHGSDVRNVILDALTITEGFANHPDVAYWNSHQRTGGGIWVSKSEVTIMNSMITKNYAESSGGGIDSQNCLLTLIDSTISKNSSAVGGGIFQSHGTLEVENSVIQNNLANGWVGGLYISSDTTSIVNSTISCNSAGRCGGIYYAGDMFSLNNSILALNEASISGSENMEGIITEDIHSSLIGIDPKFIRNPSKGPDNTWGTDDDDYGDLRLQSDSPALEAGDTSLLPADVTDMDNDGDTTEPIPLDIAGNNRIFGDTVDIGAYEYQQTIDRLPGDANLNGKVDGSDVTILASNWQAGVVNAVHATWAMGDFNGFDSVAKLDWVPAARRFIARLGNSEKA